MFSPEEGTVDAVKQWLMDFGIPSPRITHSVNQGWLAFDTTVEEAERLLHAKYHIYKHTPTGGVTPACERYARVIFPLPFWGTFKLICFNTSYHVPKHVQEHIDYITPGTRLLSATKRGQSKRDFGITSRLRGHPSIQSDPPPNFPWSTAGELSICDVAISPACIRALYDIPKDPEYPDGIPRADNSLGIYEDGDYYAQADLDLFFAKFISNIPQGTSPTPAFIDGAVAPVNVSEGGGESDLDFELAYPLIYPQTITLYQTGDSFYSTSPIGTFNTFLDAIDGVSCPKKCRILSSPLENSPTALILLEARLGMIVGYLFRTQLQ